MNVRKIDVNEFQKRKFERSFISVYVVIKPIVVETDDGIQPKNLCVFYGFTALGARKIIAIYFEDTKDNRFWLNIFEDLKSRNLKNIMFLVTPKNRNIERCAKIVYNNIEVVRSPEDIMNSITKKLLVLPDDTIIYPGHGKSTMVYEEKPIYYDLKQRID